MVGKGTAGVLCAKQRGPPARPQSSGRAWPQWLGRLQQRLCMADWRAERPYGEVARGGVQGWPMLPETRVACSRPRGLLHSTPLPLTLPSPLPPPVPGCGALDDPLRTLLRPARRHARVQIQLRATAGAQRTLSAVAFWLQLALSLASAFILIFSVAFTPQVRKPAEEG